MDAEKARRNGALAGMFMTIAAWGGNWLITPAAHPDASSARQAAVIAQVVIMAALAIWFWRRGGRAGSSDTYPVRSA
jgi:hypothetical protein